MTTPHDPREQQRIARILARQAASELARQAEAQPSPQPAFRGPHATASGVDPLAGLAAIRQIELAARSHAADYIRAAREAGHTWQDIGNALNLAPRADAQQAGGDVAEAAFTYAAGDTDTHRFRDRYITWTCGGCDKVIRDHGLVNSPGDDECGHADNCPRLAATITAWDAEWDAIEADLEAGE
jgi:hypothetical protein